MVDPLDKQVRRKFRTPKPPRALIGGKTLRLSWPFGRTLLLAGIILAALCISLEGFARTEFASQVLPLPGVGSRHRQFEILLARLEQLVAQEGNLDCLILGSSMVHHALDPQEIERVYSQETQQSIRCFNFGVRGMNPYAASVLAPILLDRYDPWLLIFGVDIPSFEKDLGETAEKYLLYNPWVSFLQGSLTLDGWLVHNSQAYRYFLMYRNWMMEGFLNELDDLIKEGSATNIYGYRPTQVVMENIALPPDHEEEAMFFEAMAKIEISPKEFRGYRYLLDLRSRIHLIVVEIPVHETFMDFIGGGLDEYNSIKDQIQTVTEREGVDFWGSLHVVTIPDSGWFNRNHMNTEGAHIFSQWIGKKLAEALQDEHLIPTR